MKKYKYIIIGSGIAGTTAAETIREKDKKGSLAILGNEKYPLYSRVLLPNYIKDIVPREKVFLRDENFYRQKNIDTFFGCEVKSIDTKNKIVFSENEYEFSYEKLLIASGGRVNKMQIEGIDDEDLCYFQTIDDADKIKEKMKNSKKALVLGSSFIALELAQAFSKNKMKVGMFIRGDRFWKNIFDQESSNILVDNLKKHDISLFFKEEIKKVKDKKAISKNGAEFEFDILGVGVGIKRNLEFAEKSGIKIKNGILADQYLKTNIDDIYSAGDVVEFYDVITEKYQMFGNWPAAFLQGKIAGLNMVGEKTVCRHVSGYNIISFGVNVSFLGDVTKDENTVVVKRGDPSTQEYSQLFLRDGKLVGATQINMNKEKGFLTMLIDKKIDLSGKIDKLKDSNFELKKLIIN